MPQSEEFCDFGTFGPNGMGIVRVVLGPPAGVQITNSRLVVTFVTSDACEPTFDAGNILLVLTSPNNVDWIVAGSVELNWSGQGTFTADIDTNIFNGFNPSRLWEDAYLANIETQVPGHFHQNVAVVDSFWEFEYIDPNIVLGDANCDGFITFDDLDAFVLGLLDPFEYSNEHPFCTPSLLDVNCDGTPNGRDVQGFLTILLNAPPVGACCLPGGDCVTMDAIECTAAGIDGTYQGDLSSCQAVACPQSQPQIDILTIASVVDNCNGTHIQFDAFGSGFNNDAILEFLQAGQDPVRVIPVGVSDHTFMFAPDFETECLASPGFWDLRVTNPDGGTFTVTNAIEINACFIPPHAVDSVTFDPAVVETCPGTTPVNPTLTLGVIVEGANLPNEFFFQSPIAQTRIHLEAVSDGESWFTAFVGDLTQLSPTEFGLTFTIFQGNVFFPVSNPPPGFYQIVVETCSQRLVSTEMVEIRPAIPTECE
jgi:hypothetical protein